MQKFFVVIILFLTVKISAQITGTVKDKMINDDIALVINLQAK